MRDEIYDRGYQDGRSELNDGLDRLFTRIANGVTTTFEVMHRVEWSAPWKRSAKDDCAGLA
jgi:hypothetical protein